jgi:5'-nucleotidase
MLPWQQYRWVRALIILISNDDGIHAKGIGALARRLSSEPEHEVYVVAPDRERSATGHSLTLHKPLRIEEIDLGGQIKAAWSHTGTPSDGVKLAIAELLKNKKPDLVISGINNGPNLGGEILYSGTVAAAMEGAYMGISSIAASLQWGDPRHYDTAAEIIARLVKVFPKAHVAPRTLINVNIPNVPLNELKGIKMTEVGAREYNDSFEKRVDPRGRIYYWLSGTAIEEGEAENSDAWAIQNQFVSISPVAFTMTDRTALEKLSHLTELHQLADDKKPSDGADIKTRSPQHAMPRDTRKGV